MLLGVLSGFSVLAWPLGGIIFKAGDSESQDPQSSSCCCAEHCGGRAERLQTSQGTTLLQSPSVHKACLAPRSLLVSLPPHRLDV